MPARVIALLLLLLAPSAVAAPPRVELYTMGPSADVFESFGHGALCVVTDELPDGICYNYGTADFRDPIALIWRFLRGHALFWVSREYLKSMIDDYTAEDRTIYRQVIDLPPEAAARLAAGLEYDRQPERRNYFYDHYRDNCTTRLRDHLDAVTGGRLRRGADVPFGRTWRDVTRDGFAIDIWLLVGMEFLVGRAVDRPMTLWDAMFLPDVLRAEVRERLGAPVEVVYTRQASLPVSDPGAGQELVLGTAGALTLLLAALALLGRRRPWRVALGLYGVFAGAIGLFVYTTAAIVVLPELRRNEVLLVCLPTDLLLVALRGRPLAVYLVARLVALAVVALGLLAGALVQPMFATFALVAGPMAVAAARELMWERALLRPRM
jgi:hypothetical protein